jgi:GTP-binding protein
MLSTVALVGRPNVGKSTLFNRLTRSRDALVADHPGVTRDRRYGLAQTDSTRFLAIDTGGLGPSDESSISSLVVRQVEFALVEADAIVLVVDHKEGLTPEDMQIAERIRRSGKPIVVAVNKCEGVLGEVAEAEFHGLGLGRPLGISALSGQGIDALVEQVASFLPESVEEYDDEELGPRIAVVGRPNVGKSTLINRLLGSDRLVTSDLPGTTRDSVFVPCERDGRKFVLIDTAGIRRRARVSDALEKYSIVQSLQAISDARVVILLLDATEGVTDQDLHLIGLVVEQGRALVIGINKWDGLATRTRNQVLRDVDRQLVFVDFAEVHQVSALHGSGIAELLRAAFVAHESAGVSIPTPRLNEVLARILLTHPPPMVRGRRIKLRYAHQGGRFPPTIVIHGTQADRAPLSYRRYLENAFREALRLRGTPVRIELRSGENPFAGRRNKLTPRQVRHRERLVRHNRRK